MNNYYFTFGQGHYSVNGKHMNNCYVRVTAPDCNTARQYFCDHFATPMMGRSDKFAFQYDAENFKPNFFPEGEFEHLIVPASPEQ